MKTLIVGMCLGTAWVAAGAQRGAQGDLETGARLVFAYETGTDADRKAEAALETLLARIRRAAMAGSGGAHPPLPGELRAVPLQYATDCKILATNTIALINPAKYVLCRRELPPGTLIPLHITLKNNAPIPYYSAQFIISKDSPIESLDSPEARVLVLGSVASTSGYILPLHKLWEAHVTSSPTLHAARHRFTDSVLTRPTGREVTEFVKQHPRAIGAVSDTYDSTVLDRAGLRTLVRFGMLPQSLVVISANLEWARDSIAALVARAFTRGSDVAAIGDSLGNSTLGWTGVRDFRTIEYRNAYADVERMISAVNDERPPWQQIVARESFTKLGLALGLAVLAVLIVVGVGRAAASRPDLTARMRYGLTLVIMLGWFYLWSHSNVVPPWLRTFALLTTSAWLGSMLRRLYRQIRHGAADHSVDEERRAVAEGTVGVIIAFGFTMLLLGADAVLTQSSQGGAMQIIDDRPTVLLTIAILAMGASLMIESSFDRLRAALQGTISRVIVVRPT